MAECTVLLLPFDVVCYFFLLFFSPLFISHLSPITNKSLSLYNFRALKEVLLGVDFGIQTVVE